MSAHPNQEWLDRSNAETLYHLERQGRTGPGLVPFLGAGISTAFGFKTWKDLLLHAAPPRLTPCIEKQLKKKRLRRCGRDTAERTGGGWFPKSSCGICR
jgi:hypothetical protein